jgi:hypothetical protein
MLARPRRLRTTWPLLAMLALASGLGHGGGSVATAKAVADGDAHAASCGCGASCAGAGRCCCGRGATTGHDDHESTGDPPPAVAPSRRVVAEPGCACVRSAPCRDAAPPDGPADPRGVVPAAVGSGTVGDGEGRGSRLIPAPAGRAGGPAASPLLEPPEV